MSKVRECCEADEETVKENALLGEKNGDDRDDGNGKGRDHGNSG